MPIHLPTAEGDGDALTEILCVVDEDILAD